ncbi:MAG: flagellar hook capping FlgD N-terminal domain-containing protein [Opitutales bacterium]
MTLEASDFVSGGVDLSLFQAAPAREIKKELGSDDFLKLLTTQMVNQDPLEPMDDTSFIAEMANFTSLEQMQTLVEEFSAFSSEQQLTSAQNFIGMEVKWFVKGATAQDDLEVTGIVEEVRAIDSPDGTRRIEAMIDGVGYDTRYIQEVRQPAG